MNGYAFIASLVASLAWPLAFIATMVLFRKDLTALLPKLRIKHSEWEASFRLDQAEKEAAALPPPEIAPKAVPTKEELDRFEQIAQLSPSAAILEERRELEDVVIKRAREVLNNPSAKLTFNSAVRFLRNAQEINSHAAALLDDLRNIGNTAAHGSGELTKEDAIRYRNLAQTAKAHLKLW